MGCLPKPQLPGERRWREIRALGEGSKLHRTSGLLAKESFPTAPAPRVTAPYSKGMERESSLWGTARRGFSFGRPHFALPGLQQISERHVSLEESPRSPALEPKVLAWWLVSSGRFLAFTPHPPSTPAPQPPSTGLFSGMDNVVYLFSQIFGLGNLP